jgi:uncharacterized membrane protein YccF (DUF307 family)
MRCGRSGGRSSGDPTAAASAIGNVIWIILAGWWLALVHLITGVLLCLTIIGIPLGLANFKLIPISLTPLGREIIDVDEARRRGMTDALSVGAPRDEPLPQ